METPIFSESPRCCLFFFIFFGLNELSNSQEQLVHRKSISDLRSACRFSACRIWNWLCSVFTATTRSYKFRGSRVCQWLFLVPVKGGRWHIIPPLAVYTTYIPLIYLIYCLLGGYMLPTTLYGNQKQPLSMGKQNAGYGKFGKFEGKPD